MSLLPIQSNNKLYNYTAPSSVVSQEVAWSGKRELKNPTQENEFPVPVQMERDPKIWVVTCLQSESYLVKFWTDNLTFVFLTIALGSLSDFPISDLTMC